MFTQLFPFTALPQSSSSLSSWLLALGFLSFATFLLSLLAIPKIVASLSQEFFLQLGVKNNPHDRKVLTLILSNILGLFLVIAGILMLFLPGQGLLTLLLGLIFLSFPGKKRFVQLLVANRKFQTGLDWLRKKNGKDPFLWPE